MDVILALRRFIAIYKKPRRMHSDNGTNFVGAERELREKVERLHQTDEITPFFMEKGIAASADASFRRSARIPYPLGQARAVPFIRGEVQTAPPNGRGASYRSRELFVYSRC